MPLTQHCNAFLLRIAKRLVNLTQTFASSDSTMTKTSVGRATARGGQEYKDRITAARSPFETKKQRYELKFGANRMRRPVEEVCLAE